MEKFYTGRLCESGADRFGVSTPGEQGKKAASRDNSKVSR